MKNCNESEDWIEPMSTFERTVRELCEAVDYWKAEAIKAKVEIKKLQIAESNRITESINHNQIMIKNLLKLCLATDRKTIEKAFKERKD